MKEIKTLYAQGLNCEQIVNIAMHDQVVRDEITRLLEQNLNHRKASSPLESQARYAMRLISSTGNAATRHSEL